MKNLIDVAAGRVPADFVLKNANVINVFTGEIIPADVAVCGEYIAGVGSYSAEKEIDCTDQYLCPGFIDAHIHIESTMVLPDELVKSILPSGTTTLIADPHEIVNVCGAKGVQLMLDSSQNLPCNIYIMLPSSVPSTSFETAGADFTAEDMLPFLGHPRVLGLGEVMCYPDVLAANNTIIEKIDVMHGFIKDGHAPGLSGKDLQAYIAAGINTEHECTTFAEALEKVRAGLAVLVREGSAAHNVSTIVSGIVDTDTPCDRFMFCTDDKHLDDIVRDGHIRQNIKIAIDLGMKPVDAIRMATWNAAREYGLPNIGAVAAGYKADLVLLKSLKKVEISAVFKDGVPAEEAISKIKPYKVKDKEILQSVKIRTFSAKDFALSAQGETHVIEMVPYQLVTNHLVEEVPHEKELFVANSEYSKLCVIERHGKNGNVAVGALKGYGIQGGAIATTVAHDSHNIIAAGDNDTDIAIAVNRLKETGGGYVLVKNGKLWGEVSLPVGGLMSDDSADKVSAASARIITEASRMGIPYHIDPFTSLSFLALPVIPSIRLTDMGLFDVENFKLI